MLGVWGMNGVLADGPVVGDANGNGVVTVADMTKVERVILGLDAATPGCDANQDGQINMADVTMIGRIILGIGYPLGDVNHDWKLDQSDVTLLEQMITGAVPSNREADLNSDGRVSIADLTLLEIKLAQ